MYISVAALIIVAWLFTPLFGRAVWGPMQIGSMSFAMMRDYSSRSGDRLDRRFN
ncbi:MAG: hypothetical protein ACQETQ_07685 [Spirochaetota bacterium]